MMVTSPAGLRRGTLSAMLTPDGRRAERAWRGRQGAVQGWPHKRRVE